MELESFQLASRQQRYRLACEATLADYNAELKREKNEKEKLLGKTTKKKENCKEQMMRIVQRLKESIVKCVAGVVAAITKQCRRNKETPRGKRCWGCGKLVHLRDICPDEQSGGKEQQGEIQDRAGNGR